MIIMPDADLDQAADALIGAGYGSAGERCMAISVAVPVGEKTAEALLERLVPRVEKLSIGLSTDREADYGPLVTKEAQARVKGYVDLGVKEGATLVVDGRGFRMQGYENGYLHRRLPVRQRRRPTCDIYKEEIFGPVLSVVRARNYEEALDLPMKHEYGNGVAIYTRDGDAARDFASQDQYRHGRHQCADPGAARLSHLRRLEVLGLRRPQPARPGFDPVLHPHQDGHRALAVGHQGRRAVRHSDDALRSPMMSAFDPFDTATVIGLRLLGLGMMATNPTAARYNEAQRMVVEKQLAVLEGLFAMQLEWTRLLMTPLWFWPQPAAFADALGRAATGPAARRVAANARRLKARRSL